MYEKSGVRPINARWQSADHKWYRCDYPWSNERFWIGTLSFIVFLCLIDKIFATFVNRNEQTIFLPYGETLITETLVLCTNCNIILTWKVFVHFLAHLHSIVDALQNEICDKLGWHFVWIGGLCFGLTDLWLYFWIWLTVLRWFLNESGAPVLN